MCSLHLILSVLFGTVLGLPKCVWLSSCHGYLIAVRVGVRVVSGGGACLSAIPRSLLSIGIPPVPRGRKIITP